MFSCEGVSDNDNFEKKYVCGSEELDDSLFVFVCALVIAMGAVVVIVSRTILMSKRAELSRGTSEARAASGLRLCLAYIAGEKVHFDKLPKISELSSQLKQVMRLFVQLAGVVLFMTVPFYCLRGTDDMRDDSVYSTHTRTYSWFWTLAFSRGVVPAALVLMSWTVTLGACYYRIILRPITYHDAPSAAFLLARDDLQTKDGITISQSATCNIGKDAEPRSRGWSQKLVWTGVFVVNAMVGITVNATYIYLTQQPMTPRQLFGLQVSLAVFSSVYSHCVIPILANPVQDTVAVILCRTHLLIANNIAIPCFATVFASPSCFQVIDDERCLLTIHVHHHNSCTIVHILL